MKRIRGLPVFLAVVTLVLAGCGNPKGADKADPVPVSKEIRPVTSLSDTPSHPESPPEGPDTSVIEALASSVLKLEVYNDRDSKIATGTGFVFGDPTMLITSAHVIVNMERIAVTKDNGDTFEISDGAVYLDKDRDIAMFRLPEGMDIPAVEPAEAVPKRGTPVFTIGSQAGLTNLVTTGIISGTWEDNGTDYLIFTAPVSGGNSGGPIFDSGGKLVGVVIGTYEKAQNLNIGLCAQELPETE
ncbi:MAG: serine protease [Lachnospiraceae bacterium]|nr:serine protease [Lachnospiraceae bacterium]